ncbi:Arp11 [Bugula neritina]|uniref:Arp11 n=1 Tax=Bugula neritina TaxID=10212 RepID=A0A7J7IRP0_BUGNE|nr:Arp11 [Bugula neritina]
MPGFKHRLQCELTSLSKTPQYSQKIAVTEFAFHEPPVKENYTAWLGGEAIFGANNIEPYWEHVHKLDGQALTRETFESNNGLVPDWSNISLMD